MVRFNLMQIPKFKTAYRLILICSGFSCLFFLAGFNFDNFTTSAHSYYASEIICSGPSRDKNCVADVQEDIRIFRGNPLEPTKITDYGNRYTSAEFAKFINLFVQSSDDFRRVILKTYLVKALTAGYLLTASLYFIRKFKYLKNLAARLLLLMFSVPYLLPGVSGVYSAPLAIIAMLLALLTVKTFMSEHTLSLRDHIFLGLNFLISISVIMSLRFETTAYLGFAMLILVGQVVFRRTFKTPRNTVITPTTMFGGMIILFALRNEAMWDWISTSFFFRAKVFTPEYAQTAKSVQVLGDLGFAAMAPVSLGVNSTLNMSHQFINDYSDQLNLVGEWRTVFDSLKIVYLGCAWAAFVIVFVQALRVATSPLMRFRNYDLGKVLNSIPALLVLLALIMVPYVARVSWFLWYVMPLLMVFLFFAEANELKSKYLVYLTCLVAAVNFLAFTASNYAFGDLIIGGMNLSWIWLSLFAIVISSSLFKQISVFFGELGSD